MAQAAPPPPGSGIDLYWIPLGAGGSGFVRLNGRVYEALSARRQGRPTQALYHTALQVFSANGRYVIETMWPSPDSDTVSRGVVVSGPVASPYLGALRLFRYEVRRWKNGSLPDAAEAVGGPQRVSDDVATACRVLELTVTVPALVWGRDQLGAGEMWNSNSVVAWLLARSGVEVGRIAPPGKGRAPGWGAGLAIAGADPAVITPST